VDRLASSGYIVFRIDYRGHDRSEGEASGAYGDPGYTIDVLNAVSSLLQYPEANPRAIGMWGHSMGGFLTLRAMVISENIKAGVIWGGVVGSYPDMLYQWRRSDRFTPTPNPTASRRWRTFFLDEYGSPEENPEFWASISANSFLAELSGPVQLHHSVDDKSVPVEFSEILSDQITQSGRTVELYTYENDDHNISQSFSLAMGRTIEFFDIYLKAP
jgi:dipeptidyl aminopeptidase/acylaminoacyl peptidase